MNTNNAGLGQVAQGVQGWTQSSLPKDKKNMYSLSVQQWNPFAGCKHGCEYCKPSFQAQAKRQLHNCQSCYAFTPHEHPNKLGEGLARTGYMEFIFTCSKGDVAFCGTEYLNQILERIAGEPAKTFLIQSKNPATFNRVAFPKNVILGVTLETNRDALGKAVAPSAPPPSQRYADFLSLKHEAKMVTIEPVLDFDLDVMVDWITAIKPRMVWLGYDSRQCNLPEPSLDKVQQLYWELGVRNIVVMLKGIRPGRSQYGKVAGENYVAHPPAVPQPTKSQAVQKENPTGPWTPELCAMWAKGAKPHVLAAIRVLASGSPKTTGELNMESGCSSGGAIVGGLNAWATRHALAFPVVKSGVNGQSRYRFAAEDVRAMFAAMLSVER